MSVIRPIVRPVVRGGVRGVQSPHSMVPAIVNDFAYRMGFKSTVTFARNSTVNGWTAGPVLTEFAIDQPAFVIDPATGKALGYRALAGFTNSLLWSDDFTNSEWSKSANASVTGNATTAPDGQDTADLLEADSDGNTSLTQGGVTTAGNGVYFLYAKQNVGDWLLLFTTGDLASTATWFDLSNGVVGQTSANSDAAIRSVGGGWLEVKLVMSGGSAGTLSVVIELANADGSSTADSGQSAYIWRANYHDNVQIAGPPIETEGSPVSTAADDASEPITQYSARTFIVEGVVPDDSVDGYFFEIDDSVGAGYALRYNQGTFVFFRRGDVQVNLASTASVSPGDSFKALITDEDGGGCAICVNGVYDSDETAVTFDWNSDMQIGSFSNLSGPVNTTIASLKYDNRRYSESEAVGVTS